MYETLLDEGFNVSYASVINAVNSIKAVNVNMKVHKSSNIKM